MRQMKITMQKAAMLVALGFASVSCGELYDYSPAGVSHNSDRFGKSTGKIDKEINKSLQKMTDRFNLIVQRYLGLKLSKVIAAALDRSNLSQEDLDLFLTKNEVNDDDREAIIKEFKELEAAIEAEKAAEAEEKRSSSSPQSEDDPL